MRTVFNVSHRSVIRAELSVGVARYLARLGQRIAVVSADASRGVLDVHLGRTAGEASLITRAGTTGVRTEHHPCADEPQHWVRWARDAAADVLWIDGFPGVWCEAIEADDVIAALGPSLAEARALQLGLTPEVSLIAVVGVPDDVAEVSRAAVPARLWKTVAPSQEQSGSHVFVDTKPEHLLLDGISGDDDALSMTGVSIQRLVSLLVDSEVLGRALRPAIDAALAQLLDNPDGTYLELARLAELHPHPDTLLAVMKFFRFQPRPDRLPLNTAVDYWRMTGDANQSVLRDVLAFGLEHRSEDVPPDFAIAVADAQRDGQDALAVSVAKHLDWDRSDEAEAIVRLLDPIVLDGQPELDVLCTLLPALGIAKGGAVAHELAERYAGRFRNDARFHVAWARALSASDDDDALRAMLVATGYNNALVAQNDRALARQIRERVSPSSPESANALVDYDGFLQALRAGHPSLQTADTVAKAIYDLYRLNRLDAKRQVAFTAALEDAAKRWAKRSYIQRLWNKLPIELDPLVPLRLRS